MVVRFANRQINTLLYRVKLHTNQTCRIRYNSIDAGK